jgi:hypothetical protein
MTTIDEFKKQLIDAEVFDEKKIPLFYDLIAELIDCKQEIDELKLKIKDMKSRDVRFSIIAKRERLLTQKRASYINMYGRLCKELKKQEDKVTPADFMDDLEDYE